MRKKSKTIFIVVFFCLITGAFPLLAQPFQPTHYYIDLIKHYMSNGELNLALQVAESDIEVDSPDSLAWLKGNIYKFKRNNQKALYNFQQTIVISQNPELELLALQEIVWLLPALEKKQAIDTLIELLDVAEPSLYFKIMLHLAKTYEKSRLFFEADDIYNALLESEGYQDSLGIRVKLAANKILQKNYVEAVKVARQSQTLSDSLFLPQALYIEFLGFYGQNDSLNSLNPLLKLYLDYPDYCDNFDLYSILAELLVYREEYLAAWFILEQYFEKADVLEKEILNREIKNIIHLITENRKPGKEFYLFKPTLRKILEK